jgi:3-oxoacyl-[acyl-carrier protein] reductase
MNLKDQVALVTGASRGIGAATATLLARHGAAVIVNYASSKKAADGVVDSITRGGGKALAFQADVRDSDEVIKMVKAGTDEFGPIDILVLNAGMAVPLKPFMELSHKEFMDKVAGEMNCFFYPLKAVVPSMIERRKGCIIGISSGLSRRPGYGFSAHSTAKSAVDGLMKSLALELGPAGIRVNTVAPGLTKTDATAWIPQEQVKASAGAAPLRRIGFPEDIAGAVLMLVSPEAAYITGAYIPVSGGTLML